MELLELEMYIYSLFYMIIAIFTCILRALNHGVQDASSSNLDTRTKKQKKYLLLLLFYFG